MQLSGQRKPDRSGPESLIFSAVAPRHQQPCCTSLSSREPSPQHTQRQVRHARRLVKVRPDFTAAALDRASASLARRSGFGLRHAPRDEHGCGCHARQPLKGPQWANSWSQTSQSASRWVSLPQPSRSSMRQAVAALLWGVSRRPRTHVWRLAPGEGEDRTRLAGAFAPKWCVAPLAPKTRFITGPPTLATDMKNCGAGKSAVDNASAHPCPFADTRCTWQMDERCSATLLPGAVAPKATGANAGAISGP